MRVKHIQCGPYANESEAKAVAYLKSKLDGLQGSGQWIILSNLPFSVSNAGTSSEIDIIVIGPSGIHIVETKHWDFRFVDAPNNKMLVDQEAEKLQRKAKIIGTTLRRSTHVHFLIGKFLLTRADETRYVGKTTNVRGTKFFQLKDWKSLLEVDGPTLLSEREVETIAMLLEPKVKPALTGDIRSFGSYINLTRIGDKGDGFRRVYAGIHAKNRDKVILYVYDYSALDATNGDTVARREFDTIRKLQKSPWLPRLVETFQDAAEYPGELFFFSVADPSAPTLLERASDKTWTERARLECAIEILSALQELHSPTDEEIPTLIHRDISPNSIYVRTSGKPLFGGLRYTKLQDLSTVAGARYEPTGGESWVAPEVIKNGLQSAERTADIYSVCASLKEIFIDESVLEILSRGTVIDANKRASLSDLKEKLSKFLKSEKQPPKDLGRLPDARYWDEDIEIPFRDSLFRVVNRLGAGGWGTTFKVLQIDPVSKEELGTYVAKTIHNADSAKCAIEAYRKARAFCIHSHLAAIYEVNSEWQANQIMALMNWIEGMPLSDLVGVVPLYAEDIGETSSEELLLRWVRQVCEALRKIHQSGYVHGDVTPKNIIVSNGELVLTDYDLVTAKDSRAMSPGTRDYSSSTMEQCLPITGSDDIFSLAATVFHVVFDRLPFEFNGERHKDRGCNWSELDVSGVSRIVRFIKKATDETVTKRFESAVDALKFLEMLEEGVDDSSIEEQVTGKSDSALQRSEIDWLQEVLRTYPGSSYGNTETRGLDTEFAIQTYVQTDLESQLLERLVRRKIQLIVLTGNAGDGKTAFLQHLATKLEINAGKSALRVIDQKMPDGLAIKLNLDGSASFQGKSSMDLLDDLFAPFQQLKHSANIAHLVAVNSGPLLSWIENAEARMGATPFLVLLRSIIEGDDVAPPWLAYIDFNSRSLVGGLDQSTASVSSQFLDRLIDSMLGGTRASEIWKPCDVCVSQSKCPVSDTVSRLRGVGAYSEQSSKVFKERLFSALRAVHQRGEIHITARELRAALTYIIFGTKWCRDIHNTDPNEFMSTGDLAFDPNSRQRQGLLLGELAKLDPGLETHPIIDRYLDNKQREKAQTESIAGSKTSVSTLRRNAFFELSDEEVCKVLSQGNALNLSGGRFFKKFLDYPLMTDDEKQVVLHALCDGLSKLVDIPSVALARRKYVPIRVRSRTLTETILWIEKPYSRFTLEALTPIVRDELETLHTHLLLTHEYKSGDKEHLEISASLFGVLMDLSEGFQLAGMALDDTFANLAIFCERLAQEDQEYLLAWHPAQEETVYKISQVMNEGKRVVKIEKISDLELTSKESELVEVTT